MIKPWKALKIAQQIIMQASAGDQVKGRMIDLQTSSEKKKEEVDRLIDTEIDIAYKKAKSMLENESERWVFLWVSERKSFNVLGRICLDIQGQGSISRTEKLDQKIRASY